MSEGGIKRPRGWDTGQSAVNLASFLNMQTFHHDLHLLNLLFLSLPASLPNDPADSNLNFELDPEIIEDEGWGVEFNHRMEVAWQTWKGPIVIQERGQRLSDCISLLCEAITKLSNAEKEVWVGGWIEKLRHAALRAGANPEWCVYSILLMHTLITY